ncbi:HTH-type transcriptional regulator YofA [Pseudoruegeria aquimaris]|uniref:HTH-type transcriptional regulator YofA n=1 Tax=Pseudoruegeria aquimaris TaxID=393663 RepID=A0A1Y5RHF6_9RHOB|nr:LysR family transcriptional regulator [Pseudoruegeria aquimaris]SLN17519.1 HTH-type transcriptional regulator YofA [Pseudoruegeria aquimaris]
MPRNLDMTALRSFVAVAESGGVTRAAGFLNLTQSAVSMQLKRLEESLDLQLLDRSGRGIALTAAGEQLLGYARRMLQLNDEVYARLTDQAYEGEVVLGVPHDIVYPAIPQVLQRFNAEYPRVRVNLLSSYTRNLKAQFARGECDLILTTEDDCDSGGETLRNLPLIWVGAPGGQAWKQRPLRLAYEHNCLFRSTVLDALDSAGIPWEMAVESDSTRTVEASVSADLAVHTSLAGMEPPYFERIAHNGALPELTGKKINLYTADATSDPIVRDLAALLRQAYAKTDRPADRPTDRPLLQAVSGG